jgi:hypothetical protein
MTDEAKTEPAETVVEAKLVPNADRERWVPLKFPVAFGDEIIDKIRVRRITGKEVQDFMTKMGTSSEFVIPPVIDCPLAVYNEMDADDQEAVEVAAQDFLPRRLQRVAELILNSGAAPSDSSPTPSPGPLPKS